MRLIDADEVMRDAEHFSAFRNALADLSDLAILLSGNPIDAVPVVRCKDCKYLNAEYRCVNWRGLYDYTKADDFCSYGERKE